MPSPQSSTDPAPSPPRQGGPPGPRRWIPPLALGFTLCFAPAFLWGDALGGYLFKLDDYAYFTSARDPAGVRSNLFKPHGIHVVPLFRLQTHLLLRAAGTLAASPAWLGGASYGTLVLAMLAAGHFVARETGGAGLGLAAMAAVGLSTVLGTSTLWYAASQALLCGVMILMTLICLQGWRGGGGPSRFALGVLFAAMAPFTWSIGYIAGPVGAVYLWADGRRRCRLGALFVPLGTAATALTVWTISGRQLVTSVTAGDQAWEGWTRRGIQVALLTTQSIAEFLMLGNLGLDSPTALTAGQGIIFCSAVALLWSASKLWHRPRRDPPGHSGNGLRNLATTLRPTPLEAAGVAMIIFGFFTVYLGRGSYDFANLRALGWYHSVPQLGAVLFAFGWVANRSTPSMPVTPASPPTARALMAITIFAAALIGLQAPRAHRIIFDYDGLASPSGTTADPPSSPAPSGETRARRIARQQRFLQGLDRIEQMCREQGIGREVFRQAFGPIRIPDAPEALAKLGIDDLLIFPGESRMTDRSRIAGLLKPTLDDALGKTSP